MEVLAGFLDGLGNGVSDLLIAGTIYQGKRDRGKRNGQNIFIQVFSIDIGSPVMYFSANLVQIMIRLGFRYAAAFR